MNTQGTFEERHKLRNDLLQIMGQEAFTAWATSLPLAVINSSINFECAMREKMAELDALEEQKAHELAAGLVEIPGFEADLLVIVSNDEYTEHMQFTQDLRHGG